MGTFLAPSECWPENLQNLSAFLSLSDAALFQEARPRVYGTKKEVRFLSRTYLWGQKLYQPLKFVLVEYKKTQAILVCTDLSMCAEDIFRA